MNFVPEPLNCPRCGNLPKIFHGSGPEFGLYELVVCECTPDIIARDYNVIGAICNWNRTVDNFDPVREKHRSRDQGLGFEILKMMKNIEKAGEI